MSRTLVIQKKSIRRSFMSSPLGHLSDHKFKHNFQDTLNLLRICGKTLKQHLITFSTITISLMKEAAF